MDREFIKLLIENLLGPVGSLFLTIIALYHYSKKNDEYFKIIIELQKTVIQTASDSHQAIENNTKALENITRNDSKIIENQQRIIDIINAK